MNTSSLGSDAVKLTFTRVLTSFVALLTAMMLSRYATLEEYGTYSQLLMIGNLASAVFMLGLPGSINYFLGKAESAEERAAFLSSYYSLTAILSFFCGLVLVLTVPLLELYFKNTQLGAYFYFFATFPWARIVSSSFDSVLIVHRRLGFLFWFRLLNASYLLGIVILVARLNLGFSAYMTLFVAGECAFAILVYVLVRKVAGPIFPSFNIARVRTILSYSIPLGLASATGLLSVQLDKLLVGAVFSQEDFAIYANASKELPVAIVSASLTAVLVPPIARLLRKGRKREALRIWHRGVLLGYCAVGLFAAGLFVYAPEVLSLLYSEPYAAGAPVFRVYCLMMVCRAAYFGMLLSASGSTSAIYWTSIVSLVVGLIIGLLLISPLGIIGPPLGSLIALLATQLLQLGFSSRQLNIPYSQIFPWSGVAKLLLIHIAFSIVFAAAGVLTPLEVLLGQVGEAVVLGVLWALVYGVLMYRPARRWYAEVTPTQ